MSEELLPTHYWLLSLPIEGRLKSEKDGAAQVLGVLKAKTAGLATTHKFALPELRVGTLDSLLTLSDELVKTCTLVEGVASKIRRQLSELNRESAELVDLAVDGVPVRRYLQAFSWNEAKHPTRRPLRETAEKLAEGVARLEEELKVKVAEYNGVKSALGGLTRKAGGTLSTRDLGDLVAKAAAAGALVDSEYLQTLFVVLPSHALKEWRARYERLCKLVVPRSSKLVAEEGDLSLFTVVLFRKAADDFRTAAKERGYQVREVEMGGASGGAAGGAAQPAASSGEEAARLTGELATRKANLEEWCRSAFGEAFAAMMHVAAVRLFVESILRYGLPPAFATALVAPDRKHEKRLRSVLAGAFGRNASAHWRPREEDSKAGDEMYPYVSISFSLP